jgi:hypothetical protein
VTSLISGLYFFLKKELAKVQVLQLLLPLRRRLLYIFYIKITVLNGYNYVIFGSENKKNTLDKNTNPTKSNLC